MDAKTFFEKYKGKVVQHKRGDRYLVKDFDGTWMTSILFLGEHDFKIVESNIHIYFDENWTLVDDAANPATEVRQCKECNCSGYQLLNFGHKCGR